MLSRISKLRRGGGYQPLIIVNSLSVTPTFNPNSEHWEFPNLYGDGLPIKSQSLNLGATDFATITGKSIVGGTAIHCKCSFYLTRTLSTDYKTILSCGGLSAAQKGITIELYGALLRVATANGTNTNAVTVDVTASLQIYKLNTVEFVWDGVQGHAATVNINGINFSIIPTYSWSGNSYAQIRLFNRTSNTNYLNQVVSYWSLAGVAEYLCNQGGGTTLYDSSGNGNNAAITTTDAISLWNSSTYFEPYALTRGCSIVGGVVIPRNEINKTLDVQGNTLQYPAGSGLPNNLSNTSLYIPANYHINKNIPAGWYTFAQLDALVDTDYLVITKTASSINNILVKKQYYLASGIIDFLTDTLVSAFNRLYYPNKKNNYIPYNKPIKIVCVGNSITQGGGASWRWSDQLYNLIAKKYKWDVVVINKGVGGKTGAQIITDFATQIAPEYDANYYCIALCSEITNDISLAGGRDAAYAVDNMNQIGTLCKNAGFDKVVGWLPVGTAVTTEPYPTNMVNAIALWRANHSSYDYLIDTWALVPDLAIPINQATYLATPSNPTEGVHPNFKGHYLMGEAFATEFINNILPPYVQSQSPQIINTGYLQLDGSQYIAKGVNLVNEFDFSHTFSTQKTFKFIYYLTSGGARLLEIKNSTTGDKLIIRKVNTWEVFVQIGGSNVVAFTAGGLTGIRTGWNIIEVTLNGNNSIKLNDIVLTPVYTVGNTSTAFSLTFDQVTICRDSNVNMIGGIKKAYMQDVFDLDFDDRQGLVVRNNYHLQAPNYNNYNLITDVSLLPTIWGKKDYHQYELRNGLINDNAKLIFPDEFSENEELVNIGAFVNGVSNPVDYSAVSALQNVTINDNTITRAVV